MLSLKRKTHLDLPTKNIGLISDTHIPSRANKIPLRVFEIFQNVDFIIHAGDLVELRVIDELEKIAPVLAVHGNMDKTEIREKLPKINMLKVYDWKIGVIHDAGTLSANKTLRVVQENKFNVFVYGHTHRSSIKWEKDVLFINPGSPTNPLPPFITKPTVAILKIDKEKIQPKIIVL